MGKIHSTRERAALYNTAMRKVLFSTLLAVSLAFGQGQAVNQMDGPTPNDQVGLFYYDGSSRLIYACYAPALTSTTSYYRSSSTLTSIVVATNVGTVTLSATAQFWVGQQLTVSGSTTAALNGTYRVATVSGSTVTITTSGVTDATYNNAAMVVSTSGPALNSQIWSIRALNYVTAGVATTYWAGPPATAVPSNLRCSDRANY